MSSLFELELITKTTAASLARSLKGDTFTPDSFRADVAELLGIARKFDADASTAETNQLLSPVGRRDAVTRLGADAMKSARSWHEARSTALDRLKARAEAAIARGNNAPTPDPQAVGAMAARIATLDAEKVRLLYAQARPDEKVLLEAAAGLTRGRVPQATATGVRWVELLDPAAVEAAQRERQAKASPEADAWLHDGEILRPLLSMLFEKVRTVIVARLAANGAALPSEVVLRDAATGAPIVRRGAAEPLDAA